MELNYTIKKWYLKAAQSWALSDSGSAEESYWAGARDILAKVLDESEDSNG